MGELVMNRGIGKIPLAQEALRCVTSLFVIVQPQRHEDTKLLHNSFNATFNKRYMLHLQSFRY